MVLHHSSPASPLLLFNHLHLKGTSKTHSLYSPAGRDVRSIVEEIAPENETNRKLNSSATHQQLFYVKLFTMSAFNVQRVAWSGDVFAVSDRWLPSAVKNNEMKYLHVSAVFAGDKFASNKFSVNRVVKVASRCFSLWRVKSEIRCCCFFFFKIIFEICLVSNFIQSLYFLM